MAQQGSIQTAFNYNLEDEEVAVEEPVVEGHAPASSDCGYADGAYGYDEASCGCESGCCDSGCAGGGGCSGGGWGSCLTDCCLGDAWTLEDYCDPCDSSPHNYGGWIQMGYHSDNTGLSSSYNDLFDFNDVPDHFHLHQEGAGAA